MKPRRFHSANKVFELEGGTEDNSLWTQIIAVDGQVVIRSVWELDDQDRERIAAGENIELFCVGAQVPVELRVTDEPLGKPPAQGHGGDPAPG